MEPVSVIKIGGNVINDAAQLSTFLQHFTRLKGQKILVHGGGKLATDLASQLGVAQQMLDGRRITDAETLKIVTMVYAGYINKSIVAQLQQLGTDAIGISGADGNIIRSHKREGDIDYGLVGDVDTVHSAKLKALLQTFETIVIAPITMDAKGQLLNTNADTIAQEVAKALAASQSTRLIYTFEKTGVLLNVEDDDSVIKELKPDNYKALLAEKKIFAGMIPKLDNAFAALNAGVEAVFIGKATALNQLLEGSTGTKIVL